MRIVVGITGASGSIYGLRLLERLRNQRDAETHLILSRAGEKTAYLETGRTCKQEILTLTGLKILLKSRK